MDDEKFEILMDILGNLGDAETPVSTEALKKLSRLVLSKSFWAWVDDPMRH